MSHHVLWSSLFCNTQRALSGWNPVVLTLETAKQHPDFQKISALLDGPFGEYDVSLSSGSFGSHQRPTDDSFFCSLQL